MPTLKKITTEITYRVPTWQFCNLAGNAIGVPGKSKCRFCVKEKGQYRCTLYNEPLATEGSGAVLKAHSCERATAGYKSVVRDAADAPVPAVDPVTLMRVAITEYNKQYKDLLKQGYPAAIAEKVASEYVLGGK